VSTFEQYSIHLLGLLTDIRYIVLEDSPGQPIDCSPRQLGILAVRSKVNGFAIFVIE
jgi:hypothetical protein